MKAKISIPVGLIALIGPPSTGKSTFARALVNSANGKASVASSDHIGEEMFSVEFDPDTHDDVVFAVRDTRLRSILRRGKAAIADSTNVTLQARERLLKLANEEGVRTTALRFSTSLEYAQKWAAARDKHVDNIDWYFGQMASATPESLQKEGFDAVVDVPGADKAFTAEEAARQFLIG